MGVSRKSLRLALRLRSNTGSLRHKNLDGTRTHYLVGGRPCLLAGVGRHIARGLGPRRPRIELGSSSLHIYDVNTGICRQGVEGHCLPSVIQGTTWPWIYSL